jgi:hypothetical protein
MSSHQCFEHRIRFMGQAHLMAEVELLPRPVQVVAPGRDPSKRRRRRSCGGGRRLGSGVRTARRRSATRDRRDAGVRGPGSACGAARNAGRITGK